MDDGATLTVASIAYRLKAEPDEIYYQAWPFDVGDAAGKGFTPKTFKNGTMKVPDDAMGWDWIMEGINLHQGEWVALYQWLDEVGFTNGLVLQNAKFDVLHTMNGTRHWPGINLLESVMWDTMLATSVVYPAQGTSLKPTCARLFGEEAVAESAALKEALVLTKKRYGLVKEHGPRYDLVPWEILGPYAGMDTVLTLRLYEAQIAKLNDPENDESEIQWTAVEKDLELMRALCNMQIRGLGPFDKVTASYWADVIDKRVWELEKTFPFQPPTPQRAKRYFFEDLGIAPWKAGEDKRGPEMDESGKVVNKEGSLTMAIALRMAASGVPHAADYAELLRLTTANRMWYRGYADLCGKDGQMRTDFRQAYVKSGRMSVERFQAQALPKHVGLVVADAHGNVAPEPRRFFSVKEGRTRVNLDLAQAELRIAAKFADCSNMLKMLETGADIHSNNTRQIFGVEDDNPKWKVMRDAAKRATFGGIFMVGPKTFQADLLKHSGQEWTLQQCRELIYGWRGIYPEFELLYNGQQKFARTHGYVELVDGSKSWFGPRDYDNTAWSRTVQGSLAIFVRDWLLAVEEMTAEHEALVLTVHDSVLLDLPTEVVDEIVPAIQTRTSEMWFDMFGITGGCEESDWWND